MDTTLKVLIVEDEAYVRDELRYLLSRHDRLVIVGEASSAFDAICQVHDRKPDVVFLDIKLHDTIDGIELGKKIIAASPATRIVLVTAFDDRAVEGFEMGVVDYVLKPFSEARLAKTVDRLMAETSAPAPSPAPSPAPTLSGRSNDKIILKKNQIWKLVDVADIYFFQARDHITTAVTAEDSYTLGHTLRELENMLPNNFLRTHKSFIVNIDFIHEIVPWFNYTYKIILSGCTEEIPVSRSYIKKFKSTLSIS